MLPETVTVAAGSSASVAITVTLSARDIKYIEKYFENGIYVEGFITLDEVGGESISAPLPRILRRLARCTRD